MSTPPHVEHLDPPELHRDPAFTNVVTVEGTARTVYVGGQNAITPEGEIVGRGDLAAQTEQVLTNLRHALVAAGGDLAHVVKWNVYVVDGQPLEAGFEAFQHHWPPGERPPAITVAVVSALAHPDFLVEIDAVAVVPPRAADQDHG